MEPSNLGCRYIFSSYTRGSSKLNTAESVFSKLNSIYATQLVVSLTALPSPDEDVSSPEGLYFGAGGMVGTTM
eukprot:scaffold20615_cov61-Skeletonema_marinoi.AAC.1